MPSDRVVVDKNQVRHILNGIFLPKDESPWVKFTAPILDEIGLHVSTIMFWHERLEVVALILQRKEPTNPDKYVGSFALGKGLLEWLSLQERQELVRGAFIATVESISENEIVSLAHAGEVADRLLGKVEPWVSPRSSDQYYWVDEDLLPRKIRGRSRQFRLMQEPPAFLFKKAEEE